MSIDQRFKVKYVTKEDTMYRQVWFLICPGVYTLIEMEAML